MDASKGFTLVCAALFLAVLYGGYKAYVSIPDEQVNRAENLKSAIERQSTRLAGAKALFAETMASANGAFLEPYSADEAWPQRLEKSSSTLQDAKAVYADAISPIIDRDHQEDVGALLQALSRAESLLKSSREDSQYPAARISLILQGRENKDRYFNESQSIAASAKAQTDRFTRLADEKVQAYSSKSDDIGGKIEGAQKLLQQVSSDFNTIATEYQSSPTDYALYADTFTEIQKHQGELAAYLKANSALLAQLDRTYVKILRDQKIDFLVVIGRANWCEGEYCGDGDQMQYPPALVDEDTYTYFDTLNMDIIARRSAGWGGPRFTLSIPQSRWDALGISPTYAWDSSKEHAEYWVHSIMEKAHHQYAIIEDGEVTQTEWVPVSGDYYWDNHNNLGMAIETKPMGEYESQTTPEPVGMAMIAAPAMVNGVATGSNQYGEWRHENGNSFWHYYGMYRLLGDFLIPRRYSYADWDGYRRHGRSSAYYGSNNQYGTYGSSTYTNALYRDSAFARRNPGALSQANTGRRPGSASSIRGAGPAMRSKGPSGGGK